MFFDIAGNESVFDISILSRLYEVDFYFIVEDNIYSLIINVKPELKPIKDLLLIDPTSSPVIANTFVLVAQLKF